MRCVTEVDKPQIVSVIATWRVFSSGWISGGWVLPSCPNRNSNASMSDERDRVSVRVRDCKHPVLCRWTRHEAVTFDGAQTESELPQIVYNRTTIALARPGATDASALNLACEPWQLGNACSAIGSSESSSLTRTATSESPSLHRTAIFRTATTHQRRMAWAHRRLGVILRLLCLSQDLYPSLLWILSALLCYCYTSKP